MSLQQKIDRITDILRRDDGITGEDIETTARTARAKSRQRLAATAMPTERYEQKRSLLLPKEHPHP